MGSAVANSGFFLPVFSSREINSLRMEIYLSSPGLLQPDWLCVTSPCKPSLPASLCIRISDSLFSGDLGVSPLPSCCFSPSVVSSVCFSFYSYFIQVHNFCSVLFTCQSPEMKSYLFHSYFQIRKLRLRTGM